MGVRQRIGKLFGVKSYSEPPFWAYDNLRYPFLTSYSLTGDKEPIENSFEAYVQQAYKADGVVFAAITARQLVFSEARFQWSQFVNGRRGELFGTPELALLENPWPNGTTGELLAHMEQDASLAGNFFATTADDNGRLGRSATGPGRRIVRMRPDWVTIVVDAPSDNYYGLDARIVGYQYQPKAGGKAADPVILMPSEVCHYSPIPDPEARFRGMSPLTPILREIQADKAATHHKARFFENAATPNMVFKYEAGTSPESIKEFAEKMKEHHEGADNAYKNMYLLGGADVSIVGKDFQQMDFKSTQGTGETRIAAALRVHPAILGLSEGLDGASLNSGNFSAARRNFIDGTIRPLWRMAAASLQTLVTPPGPGVSLWYDDRDIPFLHEDAKDAAEITSMQVTAINNLIREGWEPESAKAAVIQQNMSLLVHTGLISVQLQPPGTTRNQPPDSTEVANG